MFKVVKREEENAKVVKKELDQESKDLSCKELYEAERHKKFVYIDLLEDIQSNLEKVTTLLNTILDNYNLSNIETYGEKGLLSVISSDCWIKDLSTEQKVAINWLTDSTSIYKFLEVINDYNYLMSEKINEVTQ